jgi:hypothetical protein
MMSVHQPAIVSIWYLPDIAKRLNLTNSCVDLAYFTAETVVSFYVPLKYKECADTQQQECLNVLTF